VRSRAHDPRDYGEYLEETEIPSGSVEETNGDADQPDTDMTHAEVNGIEDANQGEAQRQVRIDEDCHLPNPV
jgi:hypothetical protein